MKLVIEVLRKGVESIFDYYSDFNRAYFLSLLGSTLLITLYSILLVVCFSYCYHYIIHPGLDFSKFFELNRGAYYWLLNNVQIILIVSFLTYALVAEYFISFSFKKVIPDLFGTLKEVSSKKLSLYITFLIFFGLFELYPDPFSHNPYYDHDPYLFGGNLTLTIWLYDIILLLLYLLALLAAYVLIHKEKIQLNDLIKKYPYWIAGILIFLTLDIIARSLNQSISLYLGNLIASSFDSQIPQILLIGSINLLITVIIVPAKIVALSFGKTFDSEKIFQKKNGNGDSILDDTPMG